MSLQKENLHDVPLWKRLKLNEQEKERETDSVRKRKQRDKTWLSLAVSNYLHANATPGKTKRENAERWGPQIKKKHKAKQQKDCISDIIGF